MQQSLADFTLAEDVKVLFPDGRELANITPRRSGFIAIVHRSALFVTIDAAAVPKVAVGTNIAAERGWTLLLSTQTLLSLPSLEIGR